VSICDSSIQSLPQAKTTKIIFFMVVGTKENVVSIEENSKKKRWTTNHYSNTLVEASMRAAK
jgi:hypothetical protein